MKRKIIPAISIIFISVLAGLFFFDVNSVDRNALSETFSLNAIFYEDEGYAEISFEDKSQKTNSAVLEILGMDESFQKTFDDSNFVERVEFTSEPKYGWQIHPITVKIKHTELGDIGLKTEIHYENEPAPPVIYTRS